MLGAAVVFEGVTRNEQCVLLSASARSGFVWGVLGLSGLLSSVWAADPLPVGNKIYVCVDAKGRRLSSDRPIPECADREQRELSGTGVTRRVIPPAQSEADLAREAEAKQAQVQLREQEKVRQKELERRNHLMLVRYPNETKHDEERKSQLESVQSAVATIQIRQKELDRQRKELQAELEFYKNDLSKAPSVLQRRFKTNDEEIAVQHQLLRHQEEERKRVNIRFDEELIELRKLWVAQQPPPPVAIRPR